MNKKRFQESVEAGLPRPCPGVRQAVNFDLEADA